MREFDGKIVLVTGASRGIGKAIVLLLEEKSCLAQRREGAKI